MLYESRNMYQFRTLVFHPLHRYCSIFVTAPSPENLKTLFEFIIKGLDAMKYEQHSDYDVVQSTNPEFKKSIVRIVMHVHEQPRQIVQYIHPQDYK